MTGAQARPARKAGRPMRILFVCHGNICRSPMAEFVMKDLVARAGAAERFEIASAATSNEEIGNPVHHGTCKVLRERGISCAGKVARRMRKADYSRYDLLIGMDHANIKNMERFTGGDPLGKYHLLMEYAGQEDAGIADPWYTGDFEATYRDVEAGCLGLLALLAPDACPLR